MSLLLVVRPGAPFAAFLLVVVRAGAPVVASLLLVVRPGTLFAAFLLVVVRPGAPFVASLLLVVRPGAPFVAFLLVVVRPGAPVVAFLLVVVWPGAPVVASLLLVVRPGTPFVAFLLVVVRPGAPVVASLLLVVRPGAPFVASLLQATLLVIHHQAPVPLRCHEDLQPTAFLAHADALAPARRQPADSVDESPGGGRAFNGTSLHGIIMPSWIGDEELEILGNHTPPFQTSGVTVRVEALIGKMMYRSTRPLHLLHRCNQIFPSFGLVSRQSSKGCNKATNGAFRASLRTEQRVSASHQLMRGSVQTCRPSGQWLGGTVQSPRGGAKQSLNLAKLSEWLGGTWQP